MKPLVNRLVQVSPFVLYSLLAATTALGQITPDNTLGNESSVVTPNVDVNGNLADLIEGGAIRESNLFHSFSDFNVAEFGRVYLANPTGIQNILSRVTGTNVSNILGTLGVLGNANLFLINPNGIVFGSNSRLDLGGSFFGSTADSVLFDDGTVFSAKNPNGKPLLTINIPSGLQYGSNPGSITNQSSLFQVSNGQTLGLIGGEVTIPGGILGALDGRIELGSVGSNGVVKLTRTDTSFVLDYSSVQEFQDISLSEGALVTTSGESGGSIQVQGANVSLRDRSFVFADTEGSGSGGGIVVKASQLSLEGGSRITADVLGSGQGGDLTVDAIESVRVIGVSPDGTFSLLGAQVFRGVTGNGGDVSITTGQLMVSDGAEVSASTRGLGDGGNLTVDASESVQVIGTSASGQLTSRLLAQTSETGNGGDVSITTGELMVSDGAQVAATSTLGEGDGGNLTVDASETVQVIGTSADGKFPSALSTQTPGTGKAGNLKITTGQLMVSDGAVVSAGTRGLGEGGELIVDADSTVQVIGTSASVDFPSGLFTQTEGTGNAKNLTITTGELIVKDGAQVSASTFGEGNGGNLIINADSTVQVIGTSASGDFPSGLFARANSDSKGNAGDVSITTGDLIVKDGARVSASTFGEGDGGDLIINAEETVQVIGTSANGRIVSGLFARANSDSKVNAGDVSITTGELIVKDGARVSASTFGEGNGGELIVDASETVQVIGTSASGEFSSGLFAQTQGTGNAKNLTITTGELIVKDGAQVSASTSGEGNGGDLIINASETVQVIGRSASGEFGSRLTAVANEDSKGNAGDVSITTGELIVKDGARVSASTFGEGNGGDLIINASETVQVIGTSASGEFPSTLSARANSDSKGNAGDVSITTGELIVKDGARVSATTFAQGNGGNLIINASETVQVIGTSASGESGSRLTAVANSNSKGNAGDVSITTGELIIKDGARVSASTNGEGDGGDLIINAEETVQVIGRSASGEFPSSLSAQANSDSKGNAGHLTITTGELIIKDGAQVSAGTFGEGDGGNLIVDASESVQVIGRSADGRFASGLFAQANRGATGNAGDVTITTGDLIVKDGARVSTRSFKKDSSAGTVEINANSIFLNNDGRITAETAGGDDSNINLYARDIRLLNGSLILTDARNTTTGGNIFIDTDTLVGLGNSDITANADEGSGGRVEINAQGIFGLEFRDRLTKDNDITATSNLGSSFSGEVTLNISQLDPTSGLTELPASPVDAEAILANDLCGFENNRIAGGSSFIITGKGGLPPTPENPVINAHRTVGWRTRPGLASSRKPLQQPPLAFGQESRKAFGQESRKAFGQESRSVIQPQPPQEKKVIIEAQGWVTAKDGTIILTAQPFRGTPVDQILPHLDCHSGGGR
ncbi:hypothetical protein BJP34_12385 [Moorena producens PAL-8-15-08-1]|uniref:Filamentous haemagglutinin FhaB/tRNA nuclease CdiA-like TPS domain-containing protein n=1 Tax=Moorena producens PAL-8-15-08-1 TaxID=1458985 RepID=A0A1D8TR75_9CYAN|nr:hypothetical protein BJP34_12385 [Moorena producens PAL-8-15-08-1]